MQTTTCLSVYLLPYQKKKKSVYLLPKLFNVTTKYLAREKVRFTAFVFSAFGKSDNTAQG